MKKTVLIILTIIAFFATGCDLEDSGGYNGRLKVTVNTNEDYSTEAAKMEGLWQDTSIGLWGHPFYGDIWDYCPHIGEDLIIGNGEDDIGSKKNFVYLFDKLGYYSKRYPVLYKGTSDVNNSEIEITGIAPGEYYVVAFYDYNGGGNKTNQLNKCDRYRIYAGEKADAEAESEGTAYVDKAKTIQITEEDDPVQSITLKVDSSVILGKTTLNEENEDGSPNEDYEDHAGRRFMVEE